MKKLFSDIYEAVKVGEDIALVSVIADSGSTPRGAGAKMVVHKDGDTLGTIGGGAVEHRSSQLAVEAVKQKKSFIQSFTLAQNDAADVGMICGGNVLVYFQYIQGNDTNIAVLESILTAFDTDENSWLVTEILNENLWNMWIQSESLQNSKISDISTYLKKNSILIEKEEIKYCIEPLVSREKVYIFGGGHISQKLVPILKSIDFNCVVIDDRPEFANKKLFPLAEKTVVVGFEDLSNCIKINPCDYVVILTRGHKNDYDTLVQILQTDACYIGLVGSRTKLGITRERLFTDGFTEGDFNRIYAPIGLAIKAVTPQEIAISIAGEMIKVRAELK